LAPIPTGASCDRCGATASGSPIAATLTDAAGHFTLTGVPAGANIPLVIQVGKWRRKTTVANVVPCAATAVPAASTRLPRRQAETSPDDNIPRIALVTGEADALECLLRRIGIADTEFTLDSGMGRVHMYQGGATDGEGEGSAGLAGGGMFAYAGTLYSSPTKLASYDMIILNCEGGQLADSKSPYLTNMENYMNAGGKVFFSHLHFYWLNHGSDDLQGTANYIGVGEDLPQPATALVNTTFQKGAALADWLQTTQATTTRGSLVIYQGQHSVSGVNPPTQEWIYVPMNPNEDNIKSTQYMTFATPTTVPEEQKCGRVVMTDLHINA